MPKRPPVNPNVHVIADHAKHAYYTCTRILADVHYRLAELAGTGQLDAAESMRLQDDLFFVWQELYSGTLCAVRDEDTDDYWYEADNTYSDGRQVMTQIRPKGWEQVDFNWEHNQFALGDGAIDEFPRGTTSRIAPVRPADENVIDHPRRRPPTDFDALQAVLLAGLDHSASVTPDNDEGAGDGHQ
jgi:hypothetical protein